MDQIEKPMDHSYDGIQEFDNPLPMWWLITFFVTIIFGFIYWAHYESGAGSTQLQELAEDMKEAQAKQKQANKSDAPESEDDLQKLRGQSGLLQTGKLAFASKCAACHGDHLQGMIGPNLVDAFWIHGSGKMSDIAKVIREGVLEKGMPSWADQLKRDEIQALTVFITSLQGSSPPNPKAPQGNKVER